MLGDILDIGGHTVNCTSLRAGRQPWGLLVPKQWHPSEKGGSVSMVLTHHIRCLLCYGTSSDRRRVCVAEQRLAYCGWDGDRPLNAR